MTGWQVLTGTICPSWMVRHLNYLNSPDNPAFSVEYIEELIEYCPVETETGDALCSKCWMDFLRGEVK
jgi:hypothetical protein|nr:MAG TPA: hypothetical protein [Caudoviricetes sp.]